MLLKSDDSQKALLPYDGLNCGFQRRAPCMMTASTSTDAHSTGALKAWQRLLPLVRLSVAFLTFSVVGLQAEAAGAAGKTRSVVSAPAPSTTVMAWGDNAYGDLDDATADQSDVPVTANALSGVKAISAGYGHSLALLDNGTVVAWGDNRLGELGNGSYAGPEGCTDVCSAVPVTVEGLSDVRAISAGYLDNLALLTNGTVMAWGFNAVGELGDDTSSGPDSCNGLACSTTPVAVSGLRGVKAIAGGGDSSFALLKNGTVMAWGLNEVGQLGDGTSSGPDTCGDATIGFSPCSDVPVVVPGLRGVKAISAGFQSSLAVLKNGTVMAWGFNYDGELGNGDNTGPDTCSEDAINVSCSTTPVHVIGLTHVRDTATAGSFNMALLTNGTVMSWGLNTSGELGTGNDTGPDICVQNGADIPCATSPVQVTGIAGKVEAVAAGGVKADFALALLAGGTVMSWGTNVAGQMGNGTDTGPDNCPIIGQPCEETPKAVSGLSGVKAVAAGAGHGIAITLTRAASRL